MDIVENFSKLHDKYLSNMLWPRDLLRSMPTNELRVMDWLGFPLKSLPTKFQSDHLVQLNMPCSRIKQLWKGIKTWWNFRLEFEEYLEQVFLGGNTMYKFSKNFAIPEYGSSKARPTRGIEMMSEDSIGAFYLDYTGRLYCVRNLGEESEYFSSTESRMDYVMPVGGKRLRCDSSVRAKGSLDTLVVSATSGIRHVRGSTCGIALLKARTGGKLTVHIPDGCTGVMTRRPQCSRVILECNQQENRAKLKIVHTLGARSFQCARALLEKMEALQLQHKSEGKSYT
ncbi:putative WRKY transcription factor 52 [Morella rubra]|uniref:Putative WRKY transcription factor 52 n=1 Tax=Morella rubra TaxID=262757 RepID=A0A6A1WD33_9ROSI|nr:putative WRKY transcription factor 52 [Morella rubra]